MIDLQGRTAIVTGGSRGIGAACVELLAKAGVDIAFTYQKSTHAAEIVQKIVRSHRRKCMAIKFNAANPKDADRLVNSVMQEYGRIDILVNNAGIWTYGEMGKMSKELWTETIDVNLNGVFYLLNKVVPIMKRQRFGKIINVSSTAGQRGEAFHSHYAASKGAIISLTKSLSTELGPYNINVNSIAPGWVDTDMSAEVLRNPKAAAEVIEGIPLRRIPKAIDIAGPVLFLASELSRHITGEILNVNGGSVLVG